VQPKLENDQYDMNTLTKFEVIYKKIKHIFVALFVIVASISVIVLAASVLYFSHLTKDATHMSDKKLKAELLDFPGSEALHNRNRDILTAFDQSDNTLIVGPKSVNNTVIKALTSSEDSLYFKHNGILPKALLRAVFQDVFNTQISSGGSTITQQLVKNQVLTNKKTYSRKANELVLAMRTEKLFTKKEILYIYLNIVPFGRDYNGANITGIASASFSLFGKSPNNLTVAESAYIVGLLQSPYYYTPYNSDGSLKTQAQLSIGLNRQHYVLRRMLVEDKITHKQFKTAEKENIKANLRTNN
jgi:transglycosylase